MATTSSTREISEMKIGDIVIVKNLPYTKQKFLKSIIFDRLSIHDNYKSTMFFVDGEAMGWFDSKDLEPVNCSIGKIWNRYVHSELGLSSNRVADTYTGKIVESTDEKWQ